MAALTAIKYFSKLFDEILPGLAETTKKTPGEWKSFLAKRGVSKDEIDYALKDIPDGSTNSITAESFERIQPQANQFRDSGAKPELHLEPNLVGLDSDWSYNRYNRRFERPFLIADNNRYGVTQIMADDGDEAVRYVVNADPRIPFVNNWDAAAHARKMYSNANPTILDPLSAGPTKFAEFTNDLDSTDYTETVVSFPDHAPTYMGEEHFPVHKNPAFHIRSALQDDGKTYKGGEFQSDMYTNFDDKIAEIDTTPTLDWGDRGLSEAWARDTNYLTNAYWRNIDKYGPEETDEFILNWQSYDPTTLDREQRVLYDGLRWGEIYDLPVVSNQPPPGFSASTLPFRDSWPRQAALTALTQAAQDPKVQRFEFTSGAEQAKLSPTAAPKLSRFYDEHMRKIFNKILKKADPSQRVQSPEEGSHYFEMTPAIREYLKKGIPLAAPPLAAGGAIATLDPSLAEAAPTRRDRIPAPHPASRQMTDPGVHMPEDEPSTIAQNLDIPGQQPALESDFDEYLSNFLRDTASEEVLLSTAAGVPPAIANQQVGSGIGQALSKAMPILKKVGPKVLKLGGPTALASLFYTISQTEPPEDRERFTPDNPTVRRAQGTLGNLGRVSPRVGTPTLP